MVVTRSTVRAGKSRVFLPRGLTVQDPLGWPAKPRRAKPSCSTAKTCRRTPSKTSLLTAPRRTTIRRTRARRFRRAAPTRLFFVRLRWYVAGWPLQSAAVDVNGHPVAPTGVVLVSP